MPKLIYVVERTRNPDDPWAWEAVDFCDNPVCHSREDAVRLMRSETEHDGGEYLYRIVELNTQPNKED